MHYVVNCKWALGDAVALSAFVRDTALAHGGRYRLAMSGHFSNVFWRNNPHVVPLDPARNAPVLRFDYLEGIRQSGRGQRIHFLSWFHREFERLTGVRVPVLHPKGDIHLSDAEKVPKIPGRYWVVMAGGKLDMTAKVWYASRFQGVVDRLASYGVACVQAGSTAQRHFNPTLKNCVGLVGGTGNERDFFSLIRNAEGVICGVTAAMHIAAVFDRPCVVIAGGREEPWWEAYTNSYNAFGPECAPVRVPHRFLHTLGTLDCCETKGCWKTRTVAIEQSDVSDRKKAGKLCSKPVRDKGQPVPLCLDMISEDHVIEAVMSYYEDGTLPPIGRPSGKYPVRTIGIDVAPAGGKDKNAGVLAEKHEDGTVTFTPLPQKQVDAHVAAEREKRGNRDVPDHVIEDVEGWLKKAARPIEATAVLVNEATMKDLVTFGQRKPQKLPAPKILPLEFKPRSESHHFGVLDNPVLGGRVTIFVLSWGDHADLLSRCLGSIIDTVPEARRDIRLALNQPGAKSLAYVAGLAKGVVTRVYTDTGDRRKYPAMRAMFHDPDCPVETPYLVWFDDDAVAIDKLWLPKLAETIVANHREGSRLYGAKFQHDLTLYAKAGHNPRPWFESAEWWRNKQLRLRGREQLAANGSVIDFVSGWFWALHVETMRAAGIPDARLNHNFGDATIGAQVHQFGAKIKMFNESKKYVWCPTKENGGRRGFSESAPWADPATKTRHKSGQ